MLTCAPSRRREAASHGGVEEGVPSVPWVEGIRRGVERWE